MIHCPICGSTFLNPDAQRAGRIGGAKGGKAKVAKGYAVKPLADEARRRAENTRKLARETAQRELDRLNGSYPLPTPHSPA